MSIPLELENENLVLIYKLLLSLILALIIGLERERKSKLEVFAGIRTFPLIAILGFVSSFIFDRYWEGIFFFSFGALIVYTAINYFLEYKKDIGITTEISSIIAFLIGVLVYFEYYYFAIFLSFITTSLLALKPMLERFAKNISQEEIISVLKFILVVAVIYPVLPDKNFGPYEAFNPKAIWKVVIIVSTLDFIGYILLKLKGSKSLWLTGVIGGLISSTAVSYELARKTKEYPSLIFSSALGIAAAWTIMNFRVIILAGIISFEVGKAVFLPLFITSILFIGVILFRYRSYFFGKNNNLQNINISNPFEVWSAIQFGILYGIVIFSIKILDNYLGDSGVYIASLISGVIDVDAITLSLSNIVKEDSNFLDTAKNGILISVISNSFFKFFYILGFGTKELAKDIAIFLVIITFVCGIFILL